MLSLPSSPWKCDAWGRYAASIAGGRFVPRAHPPPPPSYAHPRPPHRPPPTARVRELEVDAAMRAGSLSSGGGALSGSAPGVRPHELHTRVQELTRQVEGLQAEASGLQQQLAQARAEAQQQGGERVRLLQQVRTARIPVAWGGQGVVA